MSMTREEAVDFLSQYVGNDCYTEKCQEAHSMAVSALLPVTREQVEKVWRAHWNESTHLGGFVYCSRCGYNALEANNYTFCPKCGSPFTDEAVQMMMERLEALKDGKGD